MRSLSRWRGSRIGRTPRHREAARLAGQQHHQRTHLLMLADPLHRDPLDHVPYVLLAYVVEHPRLNHRRRDAVHQHSGLGESLSDRLRDRYHGGLRGRVRGFADVPIGCQGQVSCKVAVTLYATSPCPETPPLMLPSSASLSPGIPGSGLLSATVHAIGGTPPYTYSVSGGDVGYSVNDGKSLSIGTKVDYATMQATRHRRERLHSDGWSLATRR